MLLVVAHRAIALLHLAVKPFGQRRGRLDIDRRDAPVLGAQQAQRVSQAHTACASPAAGLV